MRRNGQGQSKHRMDVAELSASEYGQLTSVRQVIERFWCYPNLFQTKPDRL